MAKHFTDFSEYESGRAPSDWKQRWVLGGHSATIETSDDGTNGKLLRHVVTEQERRALAWKAVKGASTVEVVTRVRAHEPGARFGIVARGAGRGDHRYNEDGFVLEFDRYEEPKFATVSYNRRSVDTPGRDHGGAAHRTGLTPFDWQVGEWYWLRLGLAHRSTGVDVRSRMWPDSIDEPKVWDHVEANAQPPYVGAGGWFGITGQRVAGARDYDLFGVGTNGDTAPTG